LICAGTLWPIKGQAQLVSALAHSNLDRSRYQFILIGQSHSRYAEALSRKIARHQLDDCVRLVPYCPDLRPWWCAADAAVCSSESESMSASVLEAMAFGLPVLACSVGGNPEVVVDDLTGWLCEPNDLGALIAGIQRMSEAPSDVVRRLGQQATVLVRREHDRAEALARMTDLLQQVARGRY
jgi:glycosyltransferase involved in cell wall biosynthesis